MQIFVKSLALGQCISQILPVTTSTCLRQKIGLHGSVQDERLRWIILIISTTFRYYFSGEKSSECQYFRRDEGKFDSANTTVCESCIKQYKWQAWFMASTFQMWAHLVNGATKCIKYGETNKWSCSLKSWSSFIQCYQMLQLRILQKLSMIWWSSTVKVSLNCHIGVTFSWKIHDVNYVMHMY